MSCAYEEDLTAFVDGELPELRAAEVARHLGGCAACTATERLLRGAVVRLASLPDVPPASPALRRSVLAAVEAPTWRERVDGWLRPRVWVPALGVAAAAGVAAVALRTQTPEGELDAPQLELALALEVAEDYDVAGLTSVEDLELVAELHELEVQQ
ncbi:MAG: zf-HC2 domain-containing protein [Myxococcaceae bacterium]|nr:zf-HC2 domain-containing protein [Myxococcaceae bacterium]MCI0670986.1 zf-HC2 domain-containing protein [Myxococcaceae bacterium]